MTLPKHYRKTPENDKDFILSKMVQIPEHKREEVAKEYDRIYLGNGPFRINANNYLRNVAKEYRLNGAQV